MKLIGAIGKIKSGKPTLFLSILRTLEHSQDLILLNILLFQNLDEMIGRK